MCVFSSSLLSYENSHSAVFSASDAVEVETPSDIWEKKCNTSVLFLLKNA